MNTPSASLYSLAAVMILTALGIADGQEGGEEWDSTILLKMRSKASYTNTKSAFYDTLQSISIFGQIWR